MVVSSIRTQRGFIWIPPESTTICKITVESNGVEQDLTDFIHRCRVTDGVTEIVGSFEFEVNDPNEYFKNRWTGGEIFRYYADYEDGTTLRFKGVIEKPSHRNNMMRVTGRAKSARFFDIYVTQEFQGMSASQIIINLINQYGGGEFTFNNVESEDTLTTVTWFEKPFWECIQEICTSVAHDCYVDFNDDFHFFASGSRESAREAIVHTNNLWDVGDFAPDRSRIRNVVKVYGAQTEGTQVVYTARDTDSVLDYESVELIRDDNITTREQAQEIADARLARVQDAPTVGDVTGVLLASLQPGEKLYISAPEDNINPGKYDILSYEHTIDFEQGLWTKVEINKEPRNTSIIFRNIINRQNNTLNPTTNPFQLDFSFIELFNASSGTLVNLEIADGTLRLESGQVTGTWTSGTQAATNNITKASLLLNGSLIDGASVEVSNNGGLNYQAISQREQITFSATGKSLRVRVTITAANTRIDSLQILYS